MTKNKTLHQQFLEEIDKLMMIADKQLESKIITHKEYRKIMYLLIDKTEEYMNKIEKTELPKLDILNYKNIDLFDLTNVLFCTG